MPKIKDKWARQDARDCWTTIMPKDNDKHKRTRKEVYLKGWLKGFDFCKKLTEQERDYEAEQPWYPQAEKNGNLE